MPSLYSLPAIRRLALHWICSGLRISSASRQPPIGARIVLLEQSPVLSQRGDLARCLRSAHFSSSTNYSIDAYKETGIIRFLHSEGFQMTALPSQLEHLDTAPVTRSHCLAAPTRRRDEAVPRQPHGPHAVLSSITPGLTNYRGALFLEYASVRSPDNADNDRAI